RTCSAAGRPAASPGRSCSRRRSKRCGRSSARSARERPLSDASQKRPGGRRMATATLPAGPKGGLISGHLSHFRSGALDFLDRCVREYGDFVPLRIGFKKILLVSDPAAIEEVLITKSRDFIKHFGLK